MSTERISRFILCAGFLVWVGYGVLQGFRHWPAAVAFGLLASVVLLSAEAAAHIRIKLLDWVLLGYFALAAVETFVAHSSRFPAYSPIIIWTLYSAVTWISILAGAPFSLQYARESAPPERWNSPVFLQINRVISTVWGTAFVVNLALVSLALNPRYNSLLVAVLLPLLMMGASTVFTSLYTKHCLRLLHPDASAPAATHA